MKEQMAHQITCEEIEEEQGLAAREAYEQAVENAKIQQAETRSLDRKKLMYGLVDMGICPFVDVEGERQVYLFDNGIDLNKVPATSQQKEMMNLKRDTKLVARRQKERFLVKCIVEDQKLKGQDPLKYLEETELKTKEIMNMKDRQLDAVVGYYQELIQTKGSLSGERAEIPFDMAAAVAGVVAPEDAAAAAKQVKAAEKAKIKAEKAQAKAAKDAAKAEAQALKEAKKAEELAAKETAKAAKEAQKAEDLAVVAVAAESEEEAVVEEEEVSSEEEIELAETAVEAVVVDTSSGSSLGKAFLNVPVVKILGVVGVGGAGFAFLQQSKSKKEAEEESRRQFALLMGLEEDLNEDEDDGGDDEPLELAAETKFEQKKSAPAPAAEAPKKKRRGLSSVFSKKNARETDLNNLVAADATSPEFASLLAKMLTFGAPGRFPAVTAMAGGMPVEEFDLDEAKSLLSEARAASSMTDEVAAEQFASVVNCMIIDIIDLASSSLGLKEKKDSVTVDALNIVMDFMDHAASLFDACADGVAITPVTYGGTLSKSKLEQMFSIYSTSLMTSMDGSVTQDRIDTLQQVFNINDKKAEGLAQKAMMKNLMDMMKDGGEGGMEEMMKGMGGMEGMEGMEEMMKAMGGGGGEGGMPGLGDEEISPEQLKQSVTMMKELIDSGTVSKEELDLVRQQFKTMYGSDINELIKTADEEGGADELGDDGQELLDLFKTILKED